MHESILATHASASLPFSPSFYPMTEQVVLAFDFGMRRIGVALGNSITRRARPLKVVAASPVKARWAAVAQVIDEWRPTAVVVGLPRHPDGTEHAMTRSSERFGRQVAGRYGLPVMFVDERYSSAILPDHDATDADAAAVILQQWFDEQRQTNVASTRMPRQESNDEEHD